MWWSVGLFVLSTILSAAFEVYDKNNTDQEIVHWVYTSAQYLAIFASVIVYTMAITREFWMRPWSLIGLLSTGSVDSLDPTPTAGTYSVDVPFKFWNSRLHKNTEVLVICSFVFQMLYLAAHQAMKYGPLVSKEESILKDLTTGAKTANKADRPQGQIFPADQRCPIIDPTKNNLLNFLNTIYLCVCFFLHR